MRFQQSILAVLLLCVALAAVALERHFPENTKSGTIQIIDFTQVIIDGKQRTLTSGARIWSTDNMTVVPNALGDTSHRIAYTESQDGNIDRVWLLNDDEAAAMPSSRSFWSWFK